MKTGVHIGFVLVCAMCVAGCAAERTSGASAVVTSPHASMVQERRANEAIAIGRSTKADVLAALGEALVIRFDNGYEVWVYYLASSAGAAQRTRSASERPPRGESAEFVVLFSPSGVVAKTRTRPAPLSPSK